MSDRALAHIEEVAAVYPIEGKDRIVLAQVLGWTVIMQKTEAIVGERVVYVEIDSVLPEKPEFEFLRSKNFRIRTMKMAGVLSQGICFPMSILPDGNYELGQDVTDLLGIVHYEKLNEKEQVVREPKNVKHYPAWLMRYAWFRKLVLSKKYTKGFPDFIKKTDETRIENSLFYLQMKDPWIATEKCDGQSGTWFLWRQKPKYFWQKSKLEFGVCSRNLRIYEPDNSSYWTLARQYNIREVLEYLIGDNEFVALQGECLGTGIQGNKYKIDGYDLRIFNLIYPTGRLGSLEAKNIVEEHGLKFVPIVSESYVLPDTIDELREFAHGKSALYDTLREGIVFRTPDGKQSFKCVDPAFLLKWSE